jgi:hypothetical protein
MAVLMQLSTWATLPLPLPLPLPLTLPHIDLVDMWCAKGYYFRCQYEIPVHSGWQDTGNVQARIESSLLQQNNLVFDTLLHISNYQLPQFKLQQPSCLQSAATSYTDFSFIVIQTLITCKHDSFENSNLRNVSL